MDYTHPFAPLNRFSKYIYIYIETSSLRINREAKLPLSALLRLLRIYPFKLRLRFCFLNYLFSQLWYMVLLSLKNFFVSK